jgi:hypothetical protein
LLHSIRFALRAAGCAALVALVAATLPSLATGARAAGGPSSLNAPALDASAIDPTCRACDDFYQFATGGWRKKTAIPAGHASWGSFDELAQHNREALHTILEDAAKTAGAPAGSDTQKLGSFYRACMDEARIEQAGTTPIDPLLRTAAGASDAASLIVAIAKLQSAGVNDGLDFSSEPDMKDSSRTVAAIGLGGLGLPDRDYYLKEDERSAKLRAAYHDYVATQPTRSSRSRQRWRRPRRPAPSCAIPRRPTIPPTSRSCPRWERTSRGPRSSRNSVRRRSIRSTSASRGSSRPTTARSPRRRCRTGRAICGSTSSTRTQARCRSASRTRASTSAAACCTA